MIIFGYPGIGKTTAAEKYNKETERVSGRRHDLRCIDLETSCFFNDEVKRSPDWYIYYSKVADYLSKQGFIVLCGAQKEVREYMAKHSAEAMYVIFPSPDIKDEWIKRLEERFEESGDACDERAVIKTRAKLEEQVEEVMHEDIPVHLIKSMDYSMTRIIDALLSYSEIMQKGSKKDE